MNQVELQDELSTLNGERSLVEIWKREIDNAKNYHESSKKMAKEFQLLYEAQEDQAESSPSLKSNYPLQFKSQLNYNSK